MHLETLRKTFTLFTMMLLCGSAAADAVWDFDGTAEPSGAKLQLLSGTPAFTSIEGGQALAAGRALQWDDAPVLRLRPGMELRCRFRLDELRKSAQILAMKDGEYLLRIDGHERGHLSLFVQTEGQWEPRLRGPIVQSGKWYDVRARWTGTTLAMDVNGESFSRRHEGTIQPGSEPLTIGPIAGVIDRLEIRNPGFDRETTLLGLKSTGANLGAKGSFGGEVGWNGWQALGGAKCEVLGGVAHVTFPTASSMFVSPPLAIDLTHLPFACLEVETPGSDRTGHIDFTTATGAGSIAFQPLGNGRPTLIAGVTSNQWTGKLRRLVLSFSGGDGRVAVKRLVLADRAVGTPWLHIRDLAAGRAKLRPGREETVIAAVKNLGGEAEDVRLRLRVPAGLQVLGGTDRIIPYMGQNDFDMATWRIRADKPGVFEVTVDAIAAGAATRSQKLRLTFEPMPDLPRTGYVPEPRPAESDYIGLMHYCALWKEGTHYGWQRIEPWPGRRPAIGWYDEGTPEVADWHIKYALEHGVNAFIYCWYRAHMEPEIEHTLGHAIHDGLFHAKYRDKFKFCIMWENGCAPGVKDAHDLLNNVLPFWIENYFTHPSYLKLDNWTEFGEGHYVEPTSGLGFSFLNAIKRVFCTSWAPEAATDIVPEDVGLAPPQWRYEEVRAGFGPRMPWQPRRITGDLLAHWEFERVVDGRFADSSPNDNGLCFHGVGQDLSWHGVGETARTGPGLRSFIEPGRNGHVLRCGDGEATCPAPAPFFHPGGITVALWCKPDQPKQSDHWMLNTVSRETAGYRLGLGGGHPVWQIPQRAWSHGLRGPKPLPIGQWSHIAATFDNRMMRLYVNGSEVAALERPGFINPGNNAVVGGYSAGLARARFHGWLDDIRIYRRVLSPTDIATLAQAK